MNRDWCTRRFVFFPVGERVREYLLISLQAKISHLDIAQTVINSIDLCLSDWKPGEGDEVNHHDLSPQDGNCLTQIMAVSRVKRLLPVTS